MGKTALRQPLGSGGKSLRPFKARYFRHCFQSSWVASAIAAAAFPSQWVFRFGKSARIAAFA